MSAEIVKFPQLPERSYALASSVAHGISEIMILIAAVTADLQKQDLPEPLKTTLVLQMQRLAVQACSINLAVADHIAVPSGFSERIAAIIATLERAKPH